MVIEQHPTLLNVTLHPSKVGSSVNKTRLKSWEPPWMNDFQTKTIFAETGGSVNSSKNWRDGLRIYTNGASSTVVDSRLETNAAAVVLGALGYFFALKLL